MVTHLARSLTLFGALLCISGAVIAQLSDADRIQLRGFEQKIQQGSLEGIERPLLDFIIARPEAAGGYELLARLRFHQERWTEARSLYEKALSLDSDLTRAKIDLAVAIFYSGDAVEARNRLRSTAIDQKSAAADRLRLADALILVQEFEEALRIIETLPAAQRSGKALPFRAEAYQRLGRKSDLMSIIPTARSAVRTNPDAAIGVAAVLVGTEFNKQAGAILTSVLAVQPRNVRALLLLTRSKIAGRDWAGARVTVKRAMTIPPETAEAYFLLATIEGEQGNIPEGLAAIERALDLLPDSVEIISGAAAFAIRANKPRRALEIARRLIAVRPDDADAIYLFGAASLQAGRIGDAETYLGKFVALRPDDGKGCVAYSLALAAQPEKLGAARTRLQGCVANDPRNFEANYQLALSFRSSGETAQAIDYLERTVRIAPNYGYAVRDLGVLYLQAGNEQQAMVMLEKAVRLSPDDADTHFQLSRLYNLSGRAELAKQHFERFQKLRNGN